MRYMRFGARTSVLRHAQGPRSLSRIELFAAAMLLLCASTTARAGAFVGAAKQPPAASRHARLAHGATLDLSGPRMATAAAHSPALRLDAPRPLSSTGATLGAIDVRGPANAVTVSVKSSASAAFAIHWQTSPEFVRVARKFRRNGLPIVRLWESGQGLIAIGLSPHGVPGIYFTQKVQD